MSRRALIVLGLAMVAAPVFAGPLGDAVGTLTGEFSTIVSQASTFLGSLAVVGGGIRAAWLAAHGREFTTAITQAIFGAAIVAAATL